MLRKDDILEFSVCQDLPSESSSSESCKLYLHPSRPTYFPLRDRGHASPTIILPEANVLPGPVVVKLMEKLDYEAGTLRAYSSIKT